MNLEGNLMLMKTLDDAWNSQEWDAFNKRHSGEFAVYWQGRPEPTKGRSNHKDESVEFFKTFPDNRNDNDPWRVLFGQGDWTFSITNFTGTFKGPMKGFDGWMIQPTNKRFQTEFCTVVHWKNEEIVEENLFYDLAGLMKQTGAL
jgi:hypothetical protein